MSEGSQSALTEKQEAFAYAFIETGNATEAYRRAYDVDPNATDSWLHVEACQLLSHPKVAPRISQLRAQFAEAKQYTILTAADELEDARQLAMSEAQSGAAVSAVNSKVKLFGLDKPQRVQQIGSDGKPVDTASAQELARAIAHVMTKGLAE